MSSSTANEGLIGVRLLVCVVCLANLGWLIYYYGWVWTMTKHQYEYTDWSFSPVPDPVTWVDQRFNLDWTLYALMIFVLFPVYVMFWTLSNPQSRLRYDIHAISIIVAVLVCVGLFLWYVLAIWMVENNSSIWPFSVANSVNYCCKFYGAVMASHHCHNYHDCVDLPTTPTIRLPTDPIFEKHLLAIAICFGFLILQVFINAMMRSYVQGQSPQQPDQSLPTDQDNGPASSAPADMGPYLLHGVNTIYVALCCVFLTCGLLVLDVRYTHEFPASGPIGIHSARNGVEAVGLVMSASIIVLPALVLMMMAFSETRWLTILLFALVLATVLVHFFAFATMLYSRGTANRPGQPNSMANHPLRCCAGDVYGDPSSQCDNAGPCNLPVPQFPGVTLPLSSSQVPSPLLPCGLEVFDCSLPPSGPLQQDPCPHLLGHVHPADLGRGLHHIYHQSLRGPEHGSHGWECLDRSHLCPTRGLEAVLHGHRTGHSHREPQEVRSCRKVGVDFRGVTLLESLRLNSEQTCCRKSKSAAMQTAVKTTHLSHGQIIAHMLFNVAAAMAITLAARPHNPYIGVRTGCAVYVLVMVTNMAHAYFLRRGYLLTMVGAFVLFNQWATWALLHHFGGHHDVLASFIVRITWGWLGASAVAKIILPSAS